MLKLRKPYFENQNFTKKDSIKTGIDYSTVTALAKFRG